MNQFFSSFCQVFFNECLLQALLLHGEIGPNKDGGEQCSDCRDRYLRGHYPLENGRRDLVGLPMESTGRGIRRGIARHPLIEVSFRTCNSWSRRFWVFRRFVSCAIEVQERTQISLGQDGSGSLGDLNVHHALLTFCW